MCDLKLVPLLGLIIASIIVCKYFQKAVNHATVAADMPHIFLTSIYLVRLSMAAISIIMPI